MLPWQKEILSEVLKENALATITAVVASLRRLLAIRNIRPIHTAAQIPAPHSPATGVFTIKYRRECTTSAAATPVVSPAPS